MKISDVLGMSLMNLWRRKTRTVLTVLGVVIGTAAIVVMLSLGIGLKTSMMAQVETAGGLTEIMISADDSEYDSEEKLLSDKTIEELMEIDHVESIEPQIWYDFPIQVGKYECSVTLVGVGDSFLKNIDLEKGELPQQGGNLNFIMGNQVMLEFYDPVLDVWPYWDNEELPDIDVLTAPVLGGIDKEEYDPGTSSDESAESNVYSDPTFAVSADDEDNDEDNDDDLLDDDGNSTNAGNDFSDDSTFLNDDFDENESYSMFNASMKRVPLKICGVTEGDENTYTEYSYYCYARLEDLKDFLKQNYSANDIIPGQPLDRSGKPYRDLKYNQLVLRVDKSDNVEEVLEIVQERGYRAEANKEWLEEIEKEFRIIEAVLGGIGAVSMLVAAISIANTMTMSIYERTKEIGIMKVLGCGLGNIRSMFLAEAAFIGFLGGVAGCMLSFLLSFVVNKLAPSFSEQLDLAEGASISIIPPWLLLLAIAFATVIGMVAGFFPAQRATSLSPLAAIRNE